MIKIQLLDLHDDALYALCEAASVIHPPHWVFPALGEHDWQPEDNPTNLPEKTFCLGWILLSHVCRRLRNICLDSPILWAKVILAFPSSNPDARELPLARAHDTSLALSILPSYRGIHANQSVYDLYFKKMEFAKEHIHRATKLETIVHDQPHFDWRPTFSNRAYPMLTHLSIHQNPPSQLTIDAPNLAVLSVMHAIPLFTSPVYLLRTLSICLSFGVGLDTHGRGNDLVLDVLRGTPLLEELHLTLVCFADMLSHKSQTTDSPVMLAHLKTVMITVSGAAGSGLIWPAIRAPERIALQLTIVGTCHEKPVLFQSVARQMRCPDNVQISLLLSQVFMLVTSPRSAVASPHSACLAFRPRGERVLLLDDTLEHVQVATDAERVQTIHLVVNMPYNVAASAPALLAFFGAFRAVTSLLLNTDAHTTSPMYHLLTSNAASLLPSLDTLAATYSPLHKFGAMNSSQLCVMATAYWDDVIGFLKARLQAGKRISGLILFGGWPWRSAIGSEAWSVIDARAIHLAEMYVEKVVDDRVFEEP